MWPFPNGETMTFGSQRRGWPRSPGVSSDWSSEASVPAPHMWHVQNTVFFKTQDHVFLLFDFASVAMDELDLDLYGALAQPIWSTIFPTNALEQLHVFYSNTYGSGKWMKIVNMTSPESWESKAPLTSARWKKRMLPFGVLKSLSLYLLDAGCWSPSFLKGFGLGFASLRKVGRATTNWSGECTWSTGDYSPRWCNRKTKMFPSFEMQAFDSTRNGLRLFFWLPLLWWWVLGHDMSDRWPELRGRGPRSPAIGLSSVGAPSWSSWYVVVCSGSCSVIPRIFYGP